MARYIDADKLTDKLEELQFNAPVIVPVMKIYNVIELVEDTPTADVVEVVRCKECKHSCFIKSCSKYECKKGCGSLKYSNDYCSYGERKCNND